MLLFEESVLICRILLGKVLCKHKLMAAFALVGKNRHFRNIPQGPIAPLFVLNCGAVPMHAQAGSDAPYLLKMARFLLSYNCEFGTQRKRSKRITKQTHTLFCYYPAFFAFWNRKMLNKHRPLLLFMGTLYPVHTLDCHIALRKDDGRHCVFPDWSIYLVKNTVLWEACRKCKHGIHRDRETSILVRAFIFINQFYGSRLQFCRQLP